MLWIEQLLVDVRYGWSNLMRNPGFTLVAAAALALGIGANATIFGIYNAVALKPLPVADAARVVRVKRWFQHRHGDLQFKFSTAEFQYLREHTRSLAAVVASYNGEEGDGIATLATIGGSTTPVHLDGTAVSANYFVDLGVKMQLGRAFRADEDRVAGANPVLILNDRVWHRSFHSDPAILGQTIRLNGTPYTVVGVAAPGFGGTESSPIERAFWVPLSMKDQLELRSGTKLPGPNAQGVAAASRDLNLLARLQPGVPRARAQAETDFLLRQFLTGDRSFERTTAVTLTRTSYFGDPEQFQDIRAPMAAFSLLVALVLLVACANVANMMLARGAGRQREIAIRLALGAGRSRVVRQLLTESLLLSLLGGAIAIPVAAWAGRFLWLSLIDVLRGLRLNLFDLDLSPDARTFIYGLALSTLAGMLFGVVPALRCTRLDLNSIIKEDGAALGTRFRRSRLRGLLLGTQVAVSVLLILIEGAMLSKLAHSKVSELGFDTNDTYVVMLPGDPPGAYKRLRERLATLPELTSTAIGDLPLVGDTFSCPVKEGQRNWRTFGSYGSDAYFETMGIRIVRGRAFTTQEASHLASLAVISESLARRFWPNSDPIGRHLSLDVESKNQFSEREVIGVAQDAHFASMTEPDAAHVYLPTDGAAPNNTGILVFRIHGNREKALTAVQSAVEGMDRSLLPGLNLVSMADGPVAMMRGFTRVGAVTAGVMALIALALAGIGVYGVMAFLMNRRTREIGIRMALGATARSVLKTVVVQGLRPVFLGMLAGFAGAALVEKLAGSVDLLPDDLFRTLFADPAVYGELALVLAIAVLASVIPARRASRLDPVKALRHE